MCTGCAQSHPALVGPDYQGSLRIQVRDQGCLAPGALAPSPPLGSPHGLDCEPLDWCTLVVSTASLCNLDFYILQENK